MNKLNQILLIIMDGWGYSEDTKYNAIAQANPEYFNHLWNTYPHALFEASGEAVGLQKGIIGTSEIGHTIIGAGAVQYTDLVRVFKSIEDNTLKDNEALKKVIGHVKENNSTLHFMGLLSPGGVHSHQEHLFALLREAKKAGVEKVVVHIFTDGRDMPPKSADQFVQQLDSVLNEVGNAHIGTIVGRYFAMDRDSNWDRIQKALDVLFDGKGNEYPDKTAIEIIKQLHSEDKNDEFFEPMIIGSKKNIAQNDGVFFFNFRPDRARQISQKILEKKDELNLCFVTLTQYDKDMDTLVAFPPLGVKATLSETLASAGLSQVHIAETEKYAHVTYFLNGGNEKQHNGEEFILIESRKDVPTHDLAPEMKVKEIANKTIEYIEKGTNFIAINIANADMVGHTGKIEATITAIQAIDRELKRLVEAVTAKGGVAFITSDHGNAEVMFDETTNQPQTAHTLNPVPGIVTVKNIMLHTGGLADIAPTILYMFGIQQPQDMSGKNLIEENLD